MANLRQVLIAPNDEEASSWWLAFSEDGSAPFFVMPAVAREDGPAAVEAVFWGEVEVPEWTKRIRGNGRPWGSKLPSLVLYKRDPRPEPDPNRPVLHTALNHHDHELMVWWHPTMKRRICGLCYPSATLYGGHWLTEVEAA